jgi:hypothetical protein
MQPVSKEELKKLIKEGKAARKNVSELEAALREKRAIETKIPLGERKEKETAKGKRVIESTGPAREEDFK